MIFSSCRSAFIASHCLSHLLECGTRQCLTRDDYPSSHRRQRRWQEGMRSLHLSPLSAQRHCHQVRGRPPSGPYSGSHTVGRPAPAASTASRCTGVGSPRWHPAQSVGMIQKQTEHRLLNNAPRCGCVHIICTIPYKPKCLYMMLTKQKFPANSEHITAITLCANKKLQRSQS